jgi:phosphoribosyl-ATP pyrophosphohydrolase
MTVPDDAPVLDRLYATIQQRKAAAPAGSYTASLFAGGRARIAQKVGEEAIEVVLASAFGQDERVVYESADLLYHLLVLLADHDIAPEAVYAELERRMKS